MATGKGKRAKKLSSIFDHYTKEQVDEMLMCELTELINNYYEEEKAQQ